MSFVVVIVSDLFAAPDAVAAVAAVVATAAVAAAAAVPLDLMTLIQPITVQPSTDSVHMILVILMMSDLFAVAVAAVAVAVAVP